MVVWGWRGCLTGGEEDCRVRWRVRVDVVELEVREMTKIEAARGREVGKEWDNERQTDRQADRQTRETDSKTGVR